MAIENSVDKIRFATTFPIDKILKDDGTTSITVAGGSPPIPGTDTKTETNPTNMLVLFDGMFSIDGSNFYPLGIRIDGPLDGVSNQRQYAECTMTASNTTLTFYARNGFTSSKTFTIRYTLESLS